MMTVEALLTPADLARLIGMSEATVQAKASRAPADLPRRAPGKLLRWHPDAYREWAMNPPQPKRKGGRPRL